MTFRYKILKKIGCSFSPLQYFSLAAEVGCKQRGIRFDWFCCCSRDSNGISGFASHRKHQSLPDPLKTLKSYLDAMQLEEFALLKLLSTRALGSILVLKAERNFLAQKWSQLRRVLLSMVRISDSLSELCEAAFCGLTHSSPWKAVLVKCQLLCSSMWGFWRCL